MRNNNTMTIRRLVAVLPLVAVVVSTVACGAPEIGERISRADPTSAAVTTPGNPRAPLGDSMEPTAAPSLGPAPSNLRAVDWTIATVPGEFCDIPGLVTFLDGEATVTSLNWGEVHADIVPEATRYGDLDGDGVDEAAVSVGCDTGGGTGAGQLETGYVVVRESGGVLRSIGTITPQLQPADAPNATRMGGVGFSIGQLVVNEIWYRSGDATCCPTGEAETTWTFRNGGLEPSPPLVTS